MKFSIIIPTYNRGNLISKTINSVLNQSYTNFDLIIVDDGSTDDTEKVIKSFSDSRINYYKKQNAERGAARNYGMDRVDADYVTFLDSDDILYPNYLSNALESVTAFKNPPFLHLAYEIKTSDNRVVKKINYLKSEKIDFIKKGNDLSCMGVFLNKEVYRENRFSEDRALSGSEDWEFWLRILSRYGIKTDNRVSACLYDHDNRSVLQHNESELKARKQLAFKSAFDCSHVRAKFEDSFTEMQAYFDLYIATHLALSDQNIRAIKYFTGAIKSHPIAITERRSYAIIWLLIRNILNLKSS